MKNYARAERLCDRLSEVWRQVDEDVASCVRQMMEDQGEEIVLQFAEKILKDDEARKFLNHETVRSRLGTALNEWLQQVFSAGNQGSWNNYVERQMTIGLVHSRINLPPYLMNLGISIFKDEISHRIERQRWTPEVKLAATMFTNQVIDHAAATIGEPYLAAVTTNIGYGQALRVALSGPSLALECERLKGTLFNWHRTVIVTLFNGRSFSEVPTLGRSDLGLWVKHKASFSIVDLPEYTALREALAEADQWYAEHILVPSEGGQTLSEENMQALNDHVSRLALALSSVADRALATEESRDSLTRLFNRRYMHSILQHEVNLSQTNSRPFAVLLVDIDNFKTINDTHGHQVGDEALVIIADALLSNVRTSDFVFRYGGEEFLILLSEASTDISQQKAECIRAAVAGLQIPTELGPEIKPSVSIGVAIHDGHPDFNLVVAAADRALLQAKNAGKNRVMVATDSAPVERIQFSASEIRGPHETSASQVGR
ncbi:MAG: GGDEF domain-containing protein [Acidobacteriota bacterium]